jgi:hypothetical protein
MYYFILRLRRPFATVWQTSSGCENRLPQCFLPFRSLKNRLPHCGKPLPDAKVICHNDNFRPGKPKVVCHNVATRPETRGRFATKILLFNLKYTPNENLENLLTLSAQ